MFLWEAQQQAPKESGEGSEPKHLGRIREQGQLLDRVSANCGWLKVRFFVFLASLTTCGTRISGELSILSLYGQQSYFAMCVGNDLGSLIYIQPAL